MLAQQDGARTRLLGERCISRVMGDRAGLPDGVAINICTTGLTHGIGGRARGCIALVYRRCVYDELAICVNGGSRRVIGTPYEATRLLAM